jgi:uncharacterized protein YpmB
MHKLVKLIIPVVVLVAVVALYQQSMKERTQFETQSPQEVASVSE